MFKKITYSIFFLLAVQSISCTNDFATYDAEVYGLVDEFQKLIESLKQVIGDAINDARNKLKEIYNDLLDFARKIIEQVTKQIDDIIGAALVEIKELKDKANELGVDITECLSENEQAIIDMPEKLLSNLGNCIQIQIKEAEMILQNTLNEIGSIGGIINELQEDWGKCGSGLSAVVCMGKVIAKAGWQISQVPLKVAGQILKATEYIATIKSDLLICGTIEVATASKDAAFLVGKITKCVAEKIVQE